MPDYDLLPIKQIELDVNNPRIARWMEMYGSDITAEQMALALGAGSSEEGAGGPSFNSLKQSILTNQGIIHPIIVNKTKDKKYIVIEGNTRVLIYKEFKQKKLKGDWEKIPSMVYENMSEQQIDSIRLQAHLVGTRNWDPYSKAKYLNDLRNRQHLTFSQIVDFCGGDKREVETYIDAYNDMENYYRPILDSDQDFDVTRFSAFAELQKSRINEAIVAAGFSKKDFSEWVHQRKIYPLATVRNLPAILQNDGAKKIFLKESIEAAIRVLDAPPTEMMVKDATLIQLAKELYKRINFINYEQMRRLKENAEERDAIANVHDILTQFVKDMTSVAE